MCHDPPSRRSHAGPQGVHGSSDLPADRRHQPTVEGDLDKPDGKREMAWCQVSFKWCLAIVTLYIYVCVLPVTMVYGIDTCNISIDYRSYMIV